MIREELQNISANSINGQACGSHRLKQRTQFDLEMIQETGSCSGIKYSRILQGRPLEALRQPDRLHALGFVGLHR